MRKYLAFQSLNSSRPASGFWCDIDARGWVEGETPVEDYGMFMLLDQEVSPEAAGRLFGALMGHAEGEAPEVRETFTREDYFARPVTMPQVLLPDEFAIFQTLIAE